MAHPLQLDFIPQAPRAALVGRVLLVAGLAALAGLLVEHRALRSDIEMVEERVADMRRMGQREQPALREAAMDSKALAQEVRQANLVLAQLNLPWNALFRELEGAGVEGVTLLAIQPDVVSGQVRIAGEARTYDAALRYVASLEAAERFANVHLISHEVRANAPQRPVSFALVADWRPR